MNKMEIYLLRKVRQDIVEMCRTICAQREDLVKQQWEVLEVGLRQAQTILSDKMRWKLIEECRVCMVKRNYSRVWDLLKYEVDCDIADVLFALNQEVRTYLSSEAEEKNKDVLKQYHKRIFSLTQNVHYTERIVFSYTGTDNISMFVKEKGRQYKLFSGVNPWLESADLADGINIRNSDEIILFGFGGGYFVRELKRRGVQSKIKIYLSNFDIFKCVIDHLSVDDILLWENLEFIPDPTGLLFFIKMHENLEQNRNVRFYIDRAELRACVGNEEEASRLLLESRRNKISRDLARHHAKNLVGTMIERYIQGDT